MTKTKSCPTCNGKGYYEYSDINENGKQVKKKAVCTECGGLKRIADNE